MLGSNVELEANNFVWVEIVMKHLRLSNSWVDGSFDYFGSTSFESGTAAKFLPRDEELN